jgi:bifunctional ADP-heptose synthase (sugar kinase/adenylyltransferase)
MNNPRVLVVGDAMEDVYHIGSAVRLSPEAPIPVVKTSSTVYCAGGALNVVENLIALGCDVVAVTQVPPLPVKSRLLVGDTQIARWDDDTCGRIDLKDLEDALGSFDAVVVSDYCKGAITEEVYLELLDFLRDTALPVFIDTKSDPAEWDELPSAYFFPNQTEYAKHPEFYDASRRVVQKMGGEGMQLTEYGERLFSEDAIQTTVRCVAGAGDTALAAFVAAYLHYPEMYLHYPELDSRDEFALEVANIAAGVAVGRPYTSVVGVKAISRYIESATLCR